MDAELKLVIPYRMLLLLVASIVFSGTMSGLLAWQSHKNDMEYADKCHAALMRELKR